MILRSLDFESSASAYSATLAYKKAKPSFRTQKSTRWSAFCTSPNCVFHRKIIKITLAGLHQIHYIVDILGRSSFFQVDISRERTAGLAPGSY